MVSAAEPDDLIGESFELLTKTNGIANKIETENELLDDEDQR